MTTNYYFEKEQYLSFRAAWSRAPERHHLTSAHHMLYNIIRGKACVEIKKLNEIAAAAGLDDLIEKLPKRIHTVIGRQGMFTTWHERYRIGLARALAGEPDIIVLDLPRYTLTTQLANTINKLIQNQWKDRIVIVLSCEPQPGISCTKSFHFNCHQVESSG